MEGIGCCGVDDVVDEDGIGGFGCGFFLGFFCEFSLRFDFMFLMLLLLVINIIGSCILDICDDGWCGKVMIRWLILMVLICCW